MIENKNLAELITKFRKENKKIIHQKELPKLQELALKVVSESYMSYPDLKGLNEKWKNNVKIIFISRFMTESLLIFLLKQLSISLTMNLSGNDLVIDTTKVLMQAITVIYGNKHMLRTILMI